MMPIAGAGVRVSREEVEAVGDELRSLAEHNKAQRTVQPMPLCGNISLNGCRALSEANRDSDRLSHAVDETVDVVATPHAVASDVAEYGRSWVEHDEARRDRNTERSELSQVRGKWRRCGCRRNVE